MNAPATPPVLCAKTKRLTLSGVVELLEIVELCEPIRAVYWLVLVRLNPTKVAEPATVEPKLSALSVSGTLRKRLRAINLAPIPNESPLPPDRSPVWIELL